MLDAEPSSYVLLDTGFYAQTGSVFIAQAYNGCMTGSPQMPIANHAQVSFTEKLNVYPNPSTGKITIEHPSALPKLELFDLNGKRILQVNTFGHTQTEIDMRSLNNDIYAVIANGYPSIKVVKSE